MITIDWATKIITVPQSFLTWQGGLAYTLDVNAFRLALKDLEDDESGIAFPDTHRHATQTVLSGVTYARTLEIINGYTVTFEDTGSHYQVTCVGANHNLADVFIPSPVNLVIGNSAGLITVATGSGVTAQDKVDIALAVWSAFSRTLTAGAPTAAENAAAVLAAAQIAPIHADMRHIKGQVVGGTGTEADPWGPS